MSPRGNVFAETFGWPVISHLGRLSMKIYAMDAIAPSLSEKICDFLLGAGINTASTSLWRIYRGMNSWRVTTSAIWFSTSSLPLSELTLWSALRVLLAATSNYPQQVAGNTNQHHELSIPKIAFLIVAADIGDISRSEKSPRSCPECDSLPSRRK